MSSQIASQESCASQNSGALKGAPPSISLSRAWRGIIGGAAIKSPIVAAPPMTLRCAQRKLEIEPERLPRFVRFPEFGGVEVGDAFDQFIPSIARTHWRCIDQVTDRRCASNDASLRSA